jgi:hypothetical protein
VKGNDWSSFQPNTKKVSSLQRTHPSQADGGCAPAVEGGLPGGISAAGSGLAPPTHKGASAYRCFLPDLAGFTDVQSRGTRPSTPRTPANPHKVAPRAGVQSRYSGLRVQGSATAPSSTASFILPGLSDFHSCACMICPACHGFLSPVGSEHVLPHGKRHKQRADCKNNADSQRHPDVTLKQTQGPEDHEEPDDRERQPCQLPLPALTTATPQQECDGRPTA